MEIAVNRCYGGFRLSEKAYNFLGLKYDGHGFIFQNPEERSNPKLIECIKILGKNASEQYAQIEIVEIPDDIEWHIDNYGGMEAVYEKHRMW